MEIRQLNKDDKEIFWKYFQALSEKTKDTFHPHDFDRETAEKICEGKLGGSWIKFIALEEDKIIGYFFFSDPENDFPSIGICVRDGYQGRGLGKKFMNYLINEAKRMEKKGLRLNVYKDNEKAYSLYKKLGFNEERIVIHMRLKFEEEK